jgi:glycosyltransferase involved in cell wall biosynthesis
MPYYPVFLSVVFVVKNHSLDIDKILTQACEKLSGIVSDFEIIVVDNASDDEGIAHLKGLTVENGLPNLQVYALTQEVDFDTASWVGVENALGDFVAVMDPYLDDLNFLTNMLASATIGADVVFARNLIKPKQNFGYRLGSRVFNAMYKHLNGINLTNEAPQFRILNKKIINFILQHKQPALAYRHLPATGGFNRTNLEYTFESKRRHTKNLMESIDQGLRLLTSTTRAPMRLVTSLSLFGAFANLLYSVYVVAIGLFKTDVAAGWVSLSLQQSGMFFLISLVLLVLGEYILQMASLTNEGPEYHVAQEFASAQMTRLKKLNIEEISYHQELTLTVSEEQTS